MVKMSTAILPLILSLLLAACTSVDNQEPKDYEAEGLDTVVKNSRRELYIRPDIALPLYSKLYIEPLSVSYSSQKHTNSSGLTEADFQFNESELARFQEQFTKAVTEQWITTEGRGVIDNLDAVKTESETNINEQAKNDRILIVRASVTDLYLYASIKNNRPGRNDSLVNESSKMVINMDLVDASSGQVLIRSKDRRSTGLSSGPARRMTSVTYFNEVYQTFSAWIRQLASRMD